MSNRKTKKVKVLQNPFQQEPLLKDFKPRTRNQFKYAKAVIESDVTFCVGPAGCGKSTVAVGLAAKALYLGKVDKIVITRPIVESDFKSMGALPGDIREKLAPYIRPVYEELVGYFGKVRLERYIRDEVIDICPLNTMRGITFNRSIMILDEAQNAMFGQLAMFTTRLGTGSKCIINGDLYQSDLPYEFLGDFDRYLEVMKNVQGVSIVELDKTDNQRHPTVQNIISALEDYHAARIQTTGS